MKKVKRILKNKVFKLLMFIVLAALSYVFYEFGLGDFPGSGSQDRYSTESKKEGTKSIPEGNVIAGKVIKVADGDTFTLETEGRVSVKIRLYAIDAPEKGQDYGTKAREYLNDICYDKFVSVHSKGKDQYGRTLGILYVEDMNLNEDMVRQGLAWYYSHFATDRRLDSLEQLARRERLNIWSMKNPVAPHEYRKRNKN